jgi:hypothetical protein
MRNRYFFNGNKDIFYPGLRFFSGGIVASYLIFDGFDQACGGFLALEFGAEHLAESRIGSCGEGIGVCFVFCVVGGEKRVVGSHHFASEIIGV